MANELFSELELLNANIDVLIDNEEYSKVEDHLCLSQQAKIFLEELFKKRNCTYESDHLWIQAFKIKKPLEGVFLPRSGNLHKPNSQWTNLFWAKLLRARIQRKGTDCYFNRLDDLLTYLEINLRNIDSENVKQAILKIVYLLELSATALESEQMGFSERARRVISNNPILSELAASEFYDLWARYNIGVANFHQSHYRKAVLEFNRIIYTVNQFRKNAEQDEKSKKKLEFFENLRGYQLLFFPAIMYRAEVQLKLQLAYHAFETLNDLLYSNPEFMKSMSQNRYLKYRAMLIEIQSLQQMGKLKLTLKRISTISNDLFGELIGERYECKIPIFHIKKRKHGFEERFLDILIDDHLAWFDLHSGDKSVTTDYLSNLSNVFSNKYFKKCRYNAQNRKGYYQQLARFLSWMVKEAKPPVSSKKYEIMQIAFDLYKKRRKGIIEDEENKESNEDCYFCNSEGIDLRRLEEYHYESFTKNMLKFYKSFENKEYKHIGGVHLSKTKENFIKRLIRLERESREDIRIRDLKLRYDTQFVQKQIEKEYKKKNLCQIEDAGFGDLMECVKVKDESLRQNLLDREDYEHIINQWKDFFLRQLENKSVHEHQKNGLFFLGLQRWNSTSPAKGRSSGGGYLLYHTNQEGVVNLGIAIDPGFDFLHNLFHCGFSLHDIDIVLISHAHEDHIRDLESMVLLLLEQSKKNKSVKRRIHVILTLGVYQRLEHIFKNRTLRNFIEPYVIDIGKEIDREYWDYLGERPTFRFICEQKNERKKKQHLDYEVVTEKHKVVQWENVSDKYPKVEIKPTQAYHEDFSGYSDSFGFIIEVITTGKRSKNIKLGYTGDTKWIYPKVDDPISNNSQKRTIEDIIHQYNDCDTVVVHLGSLIDMDHDIKDPSFGRYDTCCDTEKEDGEKNGECEELVQDKNHPYLIGMFRMLASMRNRQNEEPSQSKRLILLGEFGEELRGGIRIDLSKRFTQNHEKWRSNGIGRPGMIVLPVDVGATFRLWSKGKKDLIPKILCVQCEKFINVDQADFQHYGTDEALYCICRTCIRATPLNVLQERLRNLYEAGIVLRTRDEA